VAISTTPDPTGTYYLYDFRYSFTLFNDYPKFGVWPDAYYMSVNQFSGVIPFAAEFAGAGACAYDRVAMLQGDPGAQQVCFDESAFPNAQDANGNIIYGGQLPSDLDGTTLPPAGEPDFFMQFLDSTTAGQDKLLEFKFHADWTDPANSTFGDGTQSGVPVEIPVNDFDSNLCDHGNDRNCIPQLGTTQPDDNIDAIPDRLMYRLGYRNFGDHESLVLNHTVNVGDAENHAGVRWYEVRVPNGTPVVTQQSTW